MGPTSASDVRAGLPVAAVPAVVAPTQAWLDAVPVMPGLDGAPGTAERLLLLVHYGIDWQGGWLSHARHRGAYWDRILPDRVTAATYRCHTLRQWWCDLSAELDSLPRNHAERAELEQHLRADPPPVLSVLRLETEALLLRTRITADAVRATRPPRKDADHT